MSLYFPPNNGKISEDINLETHFCLNFRAIEPRRHRMEDVVLSD